MPPGTMWLALVLAACAPPRDPLLDRYTGALAAYDAGRKALDAGDPQAAIAAFTRAHEADPDATALSLWLATAQATAGQTPAALHTLDDLVAAHPGASLAFYNRAAYRARTGNLDGAAADLRIALAAGVASPYAATMDPDFAPHRLDPAFARVLPPAPISARAEGPPGAVFLGSTVELKLTLVGVPSPVPTLHIAGPSACLALDAFIEEDDVVGLDLRRVLTLRYHATAPCIGQLGPFTLTLPDVPPLLVDAVSVTVEAPPGATTAPAPPPPPDLPLPAALVPDPTTHLATAPVPVGVLGMAPPDMTLSQDGRPPDVRMEHRVEGQTRTIGGWWRAAAPLGLGGTGTAEGLDPPR